MSIFGDVLGFLNPVNKFIPGRGASKAIGAITGSNGAQAQQAPVDYTSIINKGKAAGKKDFTETYGMDPSEIAPKVQNVIKKREADLTSSDPASGQAQNAYNRSLRRMKATGSSKQRINEQSRQNAQSLAGFNYSNQQTAANRYQDLVNNLANASNTMQMGQASLGVGQQALPTPQYKSGGLIGDLGTVICTELNRQGIMSDEIYESDKEYGRYLIRTRPAIYVGYNLWANPLVSLMRKSKLLTKLISIPAMKWAHQMAGNKNIVGSIIKFVGEPICEVIGNIYVWSIKWNIRKRS